jgi:hypothetical protein
MAYWLGYCLYRLDRIRLHPNEIDAALAIIMGLFSGIAWLATTPARLKELGLSLFWMVLLAAPFGVSIFALWERRNLIGWILLAGAVLAQWLLVFLPPRKSTDFLEKDSGGLSA